MEAVLPLLASSDDKWHAADDLPERDPRHRLGRAVGHGQHRRRARPGGGVRVVRGRRALLGLARRSGHDRGRPVQHRARVGHPGARPLRSGRAARPDRHALGLRRRRHPGAGRSGRRLPALLPASRWAAGSRCTSARPTPSRPSSSPRPGRWCSAGSRSGRTSTGALPDRSGPSTVPRTSDGLRSPCRGAAFVHSFGRDATCSGVMDFSACSSPAAAAGARPLRGPRGDWPRGHRRHCARQRTGISPVGPRS